MDETHWETNESTNRQRNANVLQPIPFRIACNFGAVCTIRPGRRWYYYTPSLFGIIIGMNMNRKLKRTKNQQQQRRQRVQSRENMKQKWKREIKHFSHSMRLSTEPNYTARFDSFVFFSLFSVRRACVRHVDRNRSIFSSLLSSLSLPSCRFCERKFLMPSIRMFF